MLCYLRGPAIKTGGGSTPNTVSQLMTAITNSMDVYNNKLVIELLNGAATCIKIENIPHREPYKDHGPILRNNMHNGQLKLLLTEIQFLTKVLPTSSSDAFIVYAGSSPSHKLVILLKMFPGVKFLLVDPNEHMLMWPSYTDRVITQYNGHERDILYFKYAAGNRFRRRGRQILLHGKGLIQRDDGGGGSVPADICQIMRKVPQRVFIVEDLFTDELASQLYALGDGLLLFISDIRTAVSGMTPSNADIIWNSAMHYNWMKLMKPAHWMLKFRTPFMDQSTKLEPYMQAAISACPLDLNVRGERWTYLAGDVYIQAFGRPVSTETRLIGTLGRDGELTTQEFDLRNYEERFQYYNNFHRNLGKHTDHTEYIDYDLGIDRCGDCAVMCNILRDYYTKYTGSAPRDTVIGAVRTILQTIGRELRQALATHACYELTAAPATVDEVVARLARVSQIKMLPHKHARQTETATPENTAYLRAMWDDLDNIIASAQLRQSAGLRRAFAPTNKYAAYNIKETIWNSILTYDLYGDCDFVRTELHIKLWLLYENYEDIAQHILRHLRQLSSKPVKPAETPALFAKLAEARGLSQTEADICAAVSMGEFLYTMQSVELSTIIGKQNKIVEICTHRLGSYCDIAGIAPQNYEVYSYYGGKTLDLDAEYPGATILVNMRAISQALLIGAVARVARANSKNRIIILTWRNQYNGNGRATLDNVFCRGKTDCIRGYINIIEE